MPSDMRLYCFGMIENFLTTIIPLFKSDCLRMFHKKTRTYINISQSLKKNNYFSFCDRKRKFKISLATKLCIFAILCFHDNMTDFNLNTPEIILHSRCIEVQEKRSSS